MDISSVKRIIEYHGPFVSGTYAANCDFYAYGKTKAIVRKELFKFFIDAANAIKEVYGENLENYR